MTKPLLYVISPIDSPQTKTRKRADIVLGLLKKAVDFEYDVRRADETNDGTRLTDTMLKHITTAPMCAAFLGSPPWNANVMFEIGYRLALKKPLLILSLDDISLPFDLRDFNQLRLPTWVIKKKAPLDQVQTQIDRIRLGIETLQQSPMASSYPIAEVMIDMTKDYSPEQRQQNSVFLWSSPEADRLFHVDRPLAGMQITDALDNLESHILPEQWLQVNKEQKELMGRLLFGDADIVSTVPLIFRDDAVADELNTLDEFRGRAYVAVIAQHKFIEHALILTMLYYKLTGPLQKSPDGDYFFTDMGMPRDSVFGDFIDCPDALSDSPDERSESGSHN